MVAVLISMGFTCSKNTYTRKSYALNKYLNMLNMHNRQFPQGDNNFQDYLGKKNYFCIFINTKSSLDTYIYV